MPQRSLSMARMCPRSAGLVGTYNFLNQFFRREVDPRKS